MSVTHISAGLRRLVISRAEGLCEYCLIHRNDAYFGCEIDHVISEKHGPHRRPRSPSCEKRPDSERPLQRFVKLPSLGASKNFLLYGDNSSSRTGMANGEARVDRIGDELAGWRRA